MGTAEANALIASTRELPRRAGERRAWRQTVPAPADLGVAMIGVPEGSPIALDLSLESASEGIWVSGPVDVHLVGQCVRCLTSLDEARTFQLQELYYYPGRDADEDALFVTNDQIDLEPALRDAVVLELPFSPLCRPDCAGLCPVCGADLNETPDHRHDDPVDPRWAALQDLGTSDKSNC